MKPENILLESKDKEVFIKIVDFGLAKVIKSKKKLRDVAGTPLYIAPEILNKVNYNEKCDIWSLGVLTYIMLCGVPPFWGKTKEILFEKIKNCNFTFEGMPILKTVDSSWDFVSQDAKNFLKRIFVAYVDGRPSAEELLKDKWITDNMKSSDTKDHINPELRKKLYENLKNFNVSKTINLYLGT